MGMTGGLQSFNAKPTRPTVLSLGEGVKALGFALAQDTVITGFDLAIAASSGKGWQTCRVWLYVGTAQGGPTAQPVAQGLMKVPPFFPVTPPTWASARLSRVNLKKGTYVFLAFETKTEMHHQHMYALPRGTGTTPVPSWLRPSLNAPWAYQSAMTFPIRLRSSFSNSQTSVPLLSYRGQAKPGSKFQVYADFVPNKNHILVTGASEGRWGSFT